MVSSFEHHGRMSVVGLDDPEGPIFNRAGMYGKVMATETL